MGFTLKGAIDLERMYAHAVASIEAPRREKNLHYFEVVLTS